MRRIAGALVLAVAFGVAAPAGAQAPLGSWGQTGTGPSMFKRLGGIAADDRGYVYVGDYGGAGVLKYTATGAYVRTLGRPDQIKLAEGLAIGPDGNLYVAEGGVTSTRISVWTPTGAFVRSFADYGSGPGQLASPKQIAIDGAGFVYVVDSGNARIEKFTPGGLFAAEIGRGGNFSDPDKLSLPEGVAVAPDGTIYATDSLFRRVLHFTADGTFLGGFGSPGAGDGQFDAPAGIAAAADGLYVADRSRSSLQHFGYDGTFLGRIGAPGSGPGQFSHPVYLVADCRNTLYVADLDNARIQRLGAPGAPPCGDPAADASERFHMTAKAPASQRYRREFAVLVSVSCDRTCSVTLAGTVKVAGRRRAFRLRRQTQTLDGTAPLAGRVAPSMHATDVILAALKRHKRVTATVTAAAQDPRAQRASATVRVRLR